MRRWPIVRRSQDNAPGTLRHDSKRNGRRALNRGRGRRPDEAGAANNKAVEIDPDSGQAFFNLGNGLREQGRPKEAAEALRRSIELRPDYAKAHAALATALMEAGEPRAGAAACDAYLAKDPGKTDVIAAKALALNDAGQRAAARALLDFERFIQPLRLAAP